MNLEVEQKFPLADAAALAQKLVALGAVEQPPQDQVDQYFTHPARDFARTDEALRIRRIGQHNFITYKGPKLDAQTKTRRELEIPLAPGPTAADEFADLLAALGFTPIAEVRKRRRRFTLAWQQHSVEVALDDVEGLSPFVELEITADDAGLPAARTSLASLVTELGLKTSERRSYLELLLDRQRPPQRR